MSLQNLVKKYREATTPTDKEKKTPKKQRGDKYGFSRLGRIGYIPFIYNPVIVTNKGFEKLGPWVVVRYDRKKHRNNTSYSKEQSREWIFGL